MMPTFLLCFKIAHSQFKFNLKISKKKLELPGKFYCINYNKTFY